MELVHHRGGWLEEGTGCWRTRPEKSGGLCLMEPIHAIDFFRLLAGEVSAVLAVAGPNVLANYHIPDNLCAHLFFEHGVTATLLTSHTLPWKNRRKPEGDALPSITRTLPDMKAVVQFTR